MGMLGNIEILFDGGVDVFSQGDVIKGAVILDVDGDVDQGLQKVKGVWVRFKGEARIEWTNASYDSTSGNTECQYHTQREDYLEKCLVLFGSGRFERDIDNLSIPPGRNSFPFEFQLPDEPVLPQSFEGAYGYIRYIVKANVSLKRMSVNTETKTQRPFTVVGPTVDLNEISGIKKPVKSKIAQYSCCGCGSFVERVISIGLPKRGYVPGERIYVTGQIDNRDGDEQMYFDATLFQRIVFWCGRNTRTKEYTLYRASSSVSCPRGWVTDLIVGPLLVPIEPPSGLPGCDLIDIEYYVKFRGCKCKKTIPVIIGTVPLRGAPPATTVDAPAPSAADTVALRSTVHATTTSVNVDTSEESSDQSESEETARLLKGSPPANNVYDSAPPNYQQDMRTIQRAT